jgi:hypothetical protein
MCHNDTPCLIPKNLLIYGHGQYHSHLLNTVLLCIHLKSNERRQRSHRYAGPQVCRLSTASIPPGCGMDKFQRRMPPRHPTDGNPLEVYGTSEHGGLLDIPGFTSAILQTIQEPSLYYMLAIEAGVIPVSAQLITAVENYLRFEFPIMILYWTVLWSVKASFLALYFKLFQELAMYRRVWYLLAAVTLCAYAGCWISLATSCHPLSNFFKFEQCNTAKDIWASRFSVYYSTAIDIFTDLCSKCTCE